MKRQQKFSTCTYNLAYCDTIPKNGSIHPFTPPPENEFLRHLNMQKKIYSPRMGYIHIIPFFGDGWGKSGGINLANYMKNMGIVSKDGHKVLIFPERAGLRFSIQCTVQIAYNSQCFYNYIPAPSPVITSTIGSQ